jgi:hypothetical protein
MDGTGYGGGGLLGHIVVAIVLVYPLWRIFGRAGLPPALALFIFVPVAGWLIVAWTLALAGWPKARNRGT